MGGELRETARRAGVAAAGLLVVGFAVAAFGLAHRVGTDLGWSDVVLAASFLSLPLVGAALLWVRPGQNVARLLVASGLLVTASQVASGWAFVTLRTDPGALPGGEVAAWVGTWLIVPGLGLGPFLVAVFPTGRIARAWLRWFAVLAAGALAALTVAQAIAPDTLDGGPQSVTPIPNPLGLAAARGAVRTVTSGSAVVLLAFFCCAVGDLVLRYRRARDAEREQLRGAALACGLLPLFAILAALVGAAGEPRAADALLTVGQIGMLFGLAAAIAVAVLRYRLYELDVVVRRSLLAAGLTAFVALGYVSVVALLSLLVPGRAGSAASLVAAGAVALAFQPVRVRLQRAIDRVVRGTSGEPYAALAGLGERLAGVVEPAAVPQLLVDTVVRELRLPHAAIEVDGELVATTGRPGAATQRLPIVHSGIEQGVLIVGERTGRPLRAAERRLLQSLADQAGAALRMSALAAEVQRARELAVSGREEERRRLRRDLHDGVGPALAGLALQAGALRRQGGPDAKAVARLESGLADALTEVRRMAHGLRPPALDELGLREALVQVCEGFDQGGLAVSAELPGTIPPLPAATEVAVLRIAAEALSNVARHAQAQRCCVRLRVDGQVVLEVEDDGVGGVREGGGLGLRSMRERAEEIGGSCDWSSGPTGGTVVRAVLVTA